MYLTPNPRRISSNNAEFAVHVAGSGPAVILLHGFPELAFSWRHQFPALADAGWRAIAPDLRGYGETGPQGDVACYAMANLARDVLGILDALHIDRAALLGHDFGAALAWTIARDHADKVLGIASLNTPYTYRAPQDLVSSMLRHKGRSNYMVQFQQPGVGEALLERDVAAGFRGLMRRPAAKLPEFRKMDKRLRNRCFQPTAAQGMSSPTAFAG